MEERYLTVTALTKYIKYKFDHDYHLEEVLLEGEISNFKRHSRGHFYFTLKDENAAISATMFSSFARSVAFEPSDGMKVFVKGNVTVYEATGTYQINIKEMKSDGVGDLFLAYQKLKEELSKQGYFNADHKKSLPRFPKTIGVVTSPTGAVIRDIINTTARRYPFTKIILYPAQVQGNGAKEEIVRQIERANEQNLCDVLIVGRGGGSIEDLWAFNEKIVAMAIYNSKIPIISAVGHEVDFTIADFVADVRAATPTAAAELATPSLELLKGNVGYYLDILQKHMEAIFSGIRLKLANLDKRIESGNPLETLKHKKQLVEERTKRLHLLIQRILELKKGQYQVLVSKASALNPFSIMDKGYSLNRIDGKIVVDVEQVQVGQTLETVLKNGKIKSIITEVQHDGK